MSPDHGQTRGPHPPVSGGDSLDSWIAHEAIPFSPDSTASVTAGVDRMMAAIGGSVDLIGMGEALHGGKELLAFRNALFQRLVVAHGFSAIAIESSFPRSRLVNDYVAGRGATSYDDVSASGFSHGFGAIEANRALVEWMRRFNASAASAVPVRFHGFDSPTEVMFGDSPRTLLHLVLAYLDEIDEAGARRLRERIEPHLGQDAEWENPAAAFEPALSIGLSPAAAALRAETEELISELRVRRPELVDALGEARFLEAEHFAVEARQLLTYHAAVAREGHDRYARLMGIRDAIMADNLARIVARERGRGRVLAFAHNSHLKKDRAEWQSHGEGASDSLVWWPAGAHLQATIGARYAVIGSAVGTSEDHGIGQPEPGTLEARLSALAGDACLIPMPPASASAHAEALRLPAREGSSLNRSYFPLSSTSANEFDWLVCFDELSTGRGWPVADGW